MTKEDATVDGEPAAGRDSSAGTAPAPPESGSPVSGSPVERYSDGGSFEPIAGYSRATRRGMRIAVSGTTAPEHGAHDGTYEQSLQCLRRVIAAVEALGGRREDIVRTRVYLVPR